MLLLIFLQKYKNATPPDSTEGKFFVAIVWQQITNGVDISLTIGIFILAILRDFSTNGSTLDGNRSRNYTRSAETQHELSRLTSTVGKRPRSTCSDNSQQPIIDGSSSQGVVKTVSVRVSEEEGSSRQPYTSEALAWTNNTRRQSQQ